jgi:hypothetical protein
VSLGPDEGKDDGRPDRFDEGNGAEVIVLVPKC